MLILLSNDDGINAPGIKALHKALLDIGDVVIVAPEGEQSAAGHAITITDPLRVKEIQDNGKFYGYAVDGTPADCVKIAVSAIMEKKPDIVVSGINQGGNFASNIIYSGTVSAAFEGTLLGIPSMAISMNSWLDTDFSIAAKQSIPIINKMVDKGIPKGTLLNVNMPTSDVEAKGIKVCRMSNRNFKVDFEKRHDPRGIDYYWQGGKMDFDDPDPETDINAISNNYITITPIQYDLTNYKFMDELKAWDF